MRDIHIPEFDQPEDFTYLRDIVMKHTELDQAYEEEISQILTLVPR
jgi:hypothetical protein